MQGFHMIQNFEIFISEITLFWPNYTTKRITPRKPLQQKRCLPVFAGAVFFEAVRAPVQ